MEEEEEVEDEEVREEEEERVDEEEEEVMEELEADGCVGILDVGVITESSPYSCWTAWNTLLVVSVIGLVWKGQ